MKLASIALAAALAFAPGLALAQSAGGGTPSTNTTVSNQPTAVSGTLTAVTATTTSASLAASNVSRKFLFVSNEAAAGGGSVAVCPSSVATPAVNAAGCKTLYPGQYWAACSGGTCPSDAFNIVGSASTPVLLGQN